MDAKTEAQLKEVSDRLTFAEERLEQVQDQLAGMKGALLRAGFVFQEPATQPGG